MRHSFLTALFVTVLILLAACGDAGSHSAPTVYRLDLGAGVVVAFVEDFQGKLAYVTHVPSGSQLVLNGDGRVVQRYAGRGNDPSRLNTILADEAAMERIMKSLHSSEVPHLGNAKILWIPSFVFGGITYQDWGTPMTPRGDPVLGEEDLGGPPLSGCLQRRRPR